MPIQPGDLIDRYRVIRELGRGGMATVYLVRHQTLDTDHALKVLSRTGGGEEQRLILEGQVQAQLRHPNLIAVTDVLEVEGCVSLLMEYVDGPTLNQWMQDESPALDDALALFRGVIRGVGAAHDAGIVHRDLKPGNVLISIDGVDIVPKVTDFGLAKALDTGVPGSNQTRTGMWMGTPAYTAPEQIHDAKRVDHRADIFSLGGILYELVCGVCAFQGNGQIEIMNQVLGGIYTPPSERVPDLPDAVSAAIAGCLQVEPACRIPDVQTLCEILDGRSDWAPPQIDRLAPPVTQPDRSAAAPTIDALVPLPGWVDAPAAPRADAQSGSSRKLLVAVILGVALAGSVGLCTSPPAPTQTTAPVTTPAAPAVRQPTPATSQPPPPVTPTPAPAAPPPPVTSETDPQPTPEPSRLAHVGFVGADAVRLISPSGTFGPGEVPAGTYRIEARFGGRRVHAGDIRVIAGERITLRCHAEFQVCGR